MGRSSSALRAWWVVVLCVVAGAQAFVPCSLVPNYVSPCIPYLRGAGPLTLACCSGVRGLNTVARTTPDRQKVCNWLKTIAANVGGINYGAADGLAGRCGVNFPYRITPNFNCASIR